MTAFTLTKAQPRPTPLRLISRLKLRHRMARQARLLATLPDATLHDIGVPRDEIAATVRRRMGHG